ncbi:voltage-gated potassium channel [Halogranum rubrum]|uniref:Voltage-gated potassium channel n=1 Tax=Halogranum rubrum TaxID=553466 RepID=A0A1I4BHP2_9EURY|nr:ion transporter [Halogranum rubrum]SFK68382.1 voltage-gated potassium channel [Halogranum rubrum]
MDEPVKRRVWAVLNGDDRSALGVAVNAFILGLIVLNLGIFILETVDPVYERFSGVFRLILQFSLVVFTIEFVLRVWSSTTAPDYAGPLTGRLRFLSRPYPLIDLVAILPFYLGAFVDLQFLRFLRLFWFLRLFRRDRYVESRRRFVGAYRAQREDLFVASAGATTLFVASSVSMYFAEHTAQPEAFSSIPETMWWSIVTLTTVGYGDVVPVTPLGRLLGALTALGGIALFAVPSSILAAGFVKQAGESTAVDRCPHCGNRIDGPDQPNRETPDGPQ